MIPLKVLSCDGCGGSCCREMRSPPFIVYIENGEWKAYNGDDVFGDFKNLMAAPAEAREVMRAGLFSDRPDRSPCSWLDQATGKCRWYEFRPDVCRGLDVGSQGCLDWRKKFRVGHKPAKTYRYERGRLVKS